MANVRARLYILDDSSNVTYAGNSSNGLFVWAAQLELEEYFHDALQNYNNFKYIRSTGSRQDFIGSKYRLDSSPDVVPALDLLRTIFGINLGRFGDGSVKDESDINTVYNQGFLRMQSYSDSFDYFAEDYVGESRVLTY